MSELIALSFDADASPEISFERSLTSPFASSGWGAAWYPAGELTAAVIRDPFSGESTGLGSIMHNFDRFRTTLIVAHLRGAAQRATHRDTHPFVRHWGGRSWTLAHDGSLAGDLSSGLPLPIGPQFIPGGPTDTEHLFSWMLAQAAATGCSSLSDAGFATVGGWLADANRLGSLNVVLADGDDLVAHRDANGTGTLWWSRFTPPHASTTLTSAGITVQIGTGEDVHRTALVVASIPLSESGWTELAPGETIVARRGDLLFSSRSTTPPSAPISWPPQATAPVPVAPSGPGATPARPPRRRLAVTHTTRYRYDDPVERSSHRFRLTPVADSLQRVEQYQLDLNCEGTSFRFEDVFGNDVTGFEISEPFTDLTVTARAVVEVIEPFDRPELLPERHTLPLVWMPWQHQMMTPYLLPPELPENQLRDLGDYAMSFAHRNRGDLLAALDDITSTVYSDYAYQPGFTSLETTPYQVFEARAGVCQDFANLMISVCRLLAVPARYRVGYIFTGANYENTMQSEASHAWVEVYLPHLGWRGYDPTNGCRVGSDHIRVATGRNYRDATPTAGVIRRGGSGETLDLSVVVKEVGDT